MIPGKKPPLGRALALWFGSFAATGALLFFYAGVGFYLILAAGAATLGITLWRHSRSKER